MLRSAMLSRSIRMPRCIAMAVGAGARGRRTARVPLASYLAPGAKSDLHSRVTLACAPALGGTISQIRRSKSDHFK